LTICFSNPDRNKWHIYSPTRADPTGIQPAPAKWLGERLLLVFLFVQELAQTSLLQLTLQMETVCLNFSAYVFFYFGAKWPAPKKTTDCFTYAIHQIEELRTPLSVREIW